MKFSLPFKAFLVYLGCTAADFVSSMGHWPPDFHEANPFARHMDGSFWPLHALGNCAIDTLETVLVTAGLYYAVRYISKRAALFVAALPWLYYAYGHLDAAFQNLQVKFFFVPYAEPDRVLEFLKGLLF